MKISDIKPEVYDMAKRAEAKLRARFQEIFGLPFDSHEVINGFHFIALTTTHGCDFDERLLTYAKTELKKAAAEEAL